MLSIGSSPIAEKLGAIMGGSSDSPRSGVRVDLPTPVYLALIALVGMLGLALRVVDLDTIPPGLHFDQAANGLLSLQILGGQRPLFFPSYAGREALFMYVIAWLSALIGPGIVALRLASALCGAATVVTLALLGATLFGRRVGVIAAAILAGLYWHLHVSRLGERTIMVPLLDVLALLALWLAYRRRSLALAIVGGGLTGLQLYTYPSSRFFLLAVGGIGLSEIALIGLRRLRGVKNLPALWPCLVQGVLVLGTASLVVIPLALYVVHNPSVFLERPDEVAVWNVRGGGWVTALVNSTRRTVGMFFVEGDPDWKYNLAGQPVFDPITGALFLLGIVGAFGRITKPAERAGLIWLFCMLLPGFLSIDAPQFMRTLGAAPAAALLAARGIFLAATWLSGRSSAWRRLAPIFWGWPLVAGGLASYRYFEVWAPSPAAYLALEGDVTAAAAVIRAQSPKYAITYVASRYGPDPTESYLDGDLFGRLRWFDGRAALPLPPPGSGPTLYVLPRTATDTFWYGALPPENRVATVAAPDTGPAVEAFVLQPSTRLVSTNAAKTGDFPSLDFAGVAQLVSADTPLLLQAGQPTSPAFTWRLERPPAEPLKFFVHLVDATGQGWSQYDEEVYPSSQWSPGQNLIVRYPLTIPSDVPLGMYTIETGLERANGTALTALDAAGKPVGTVWRSQPLTMVRAAHSTDVASLRINHPLDVTFSNALRLVGVDPPVASAQDGDTVDLTFYWQVTGVAPTALVTVVQAVDARGVVVGQTIRPPTGGLWPARDWQSGDVVVDRQRLLLPAGLPSGPLTLRVGLRDSSGHPLEPVNQPVPEIPVASLTLQSRPRVAATVTIGHPQLVAFVNSFRLLGYDLDPTTGRPGDTLHVRLYWQADAPIDRGWTVFTHLLDSNDQIRAQEDAVPDHGKRPTTSWAPGETIVDAHDLVVQPGAPSGSQRIEVGLYDAATGERLKTLNGEDRVLLDEPVLVGR